MRIPKRGEKGFTLIELLIVVAILGVLAAVVVPNVGRFLGRGEIEARRAEKHNIQAAVTAMMVDNNLATIPNPLIGFANATKDMSSYPDIASAVTTADKLNDPLGVAYDVGDDDGYLLYGHDRTSGAGTKVNYVSIKTAKYLYSAEADGTIHQWSDAGVEELD
ncbi:MAG: type II secretion system protein [Dehalococcoidia bacterium]|nr:type II secretion system protein [Dehalococcoidia bacterium]